MDELVKKLIDVKARWTARENQISLLDVSQIKAMLNQEEPKNEDNLTFSAAATAADSFVQNVDWRNHNGNHVTAVKNQFSCGSCVSFCTVAVTESMASIEKGQLFDLSEADQHYCSAHGASCSGWNALSGFNEIKNRGVCNEASFPYATGFPNNDTGYYWLASHPLSPICRINPNRNESVIKVANVHNLGTNQTAVKNHLTNIGPVSCSFAVYEDFTTYGAGTYHHVTGDLLGYHCIQVVGYSEAGQYWICKNSWGTGFGMSGFINIGYGECGIDTRDKVGASGIILPPIAHGWFGYENLGGVIISKPNAVSWGPNRIDVVATGTDSQVFHKWWNGSSWNGWEPLGGTIQGAPSICSWANGRLDIFAVGTNHHLFHKWYQGGWSGWEDLGGLLSSEPACVSWGNNRIDIFARGMNSSMWHLWWDGAWHGWEDLGGIITSAPAVSSWAVGRLDCFARGTNNHLFHKWFQNGWSNWEDLGSQVFDNPGAVSWGLNRIDVFFPGVNYNMMHKWWDGHAWSGDENLGGILSSGVGVSSWQAGRLDCFVEGTNSAMFHKWYK